MAHVGYIRVSTVEQNTARQLAEVSLDKVFEDKASGKNIDGRPQLDLCLDYCREGDVLHVHSMDRLARNLQDLLAIVSKLTGKGVKVRFEKEGIEFDGSNESPMATLMLQLMGAFAQFERSLILERQREGIAQAKARGAYKGRKPISKDKILEVERHIDAGLSIVKACEKAGISRAAYYTAKK